MSRIEIPNLSVAEAIMKIEWVIDPVPWLTIADAVQKPVLLEKIKYLNEKAQLQTDFLQQFNEIQNNYLLSLSKLTQNYNDLVGKAIGLR